MPDIVKLRVVLHVVPPDVMEYVTVPEPEAVAVNSPLLFILAIPEGLVITDQVPPEVPFVENVVVAPLQVVPGVGLIVPAEITVILIGSELIVTLFAEQVARR